MLSVKTSNLYVCEHKSSKSFKEAVVKQKLFLAFYKKTIHDGVKATFKGTVRPVWICMRMVPLDSPRKEHRPLKFWVFLFWTWIFEKSSVLLHTKIHLISTFFVISSFSWRTFIWWKNMPKLCTTRIRIRLGDTKPPLKHKMYVQVILKKRKSQVKQSCKNTRMRSQQTVFSIPLKALTDHFRGGSRVVSFDPYS